MDKKGRRIKVKKKKVVRQKRGIVGIADKKGSPFVPNIREIMCVLALSLTVFTFLVLVTPFAGEGGKKIGDFLKENLGLAAFLLILFWIMLSRLFLEFKESSFVLWKYLFFHFLWLFSGIALLALVGQGGNLSQANWLQWLKYNLGEGGSFLLLFTLVIIFSLIITRVSLQKVANLLLAGYSKILHLLILVFRAILRLFSLTLKSIFNYIASQKRLSPKISSGVRPQSFYRDQEPAVRDQGIKNREQMEQISPATANANIQVEDGEVKDTKEAEVDIAEEPVKGYKMEEEKVETEPGSAIKELYHLPLISVLDAAVVERKKKPRIEPSDYSHLLEDTLASFGVEAKVIRVERGPTVTRYELQPARGVKVSRIVSLSDDLALALAAISLRIEAPIPGKSAIGIEVPNSSVDTVYLRDLFEDEAFRNSSFRLKLALGKDIAGKIILADLVRMPHLLIAGATGSGKTVCVNTLIASLLFKATPLEVQFVMIDPKRVELTIYNGIPHLIREVVTDPKMAARTLMELTTIMDNRYDLFAQARVRNIEEYNRSHSQEPLPYIVVIIDELADLMMFAAAAVENYISRLAATARAAGIHLIVATQRPSVDVITGTIKANIPSRISFAVSSHNDSRTILDTVGAEKLLGRGDMLYMPIDASKPIRVQGAFIGLEEIEALSDYWRGQSEPINKVELSLEAGIPEEKENDVDVGDELYEQAKEIILTTGYASVSNLQRKLKIGYARAGRLMDLMEQRGVVGPADGSKPRKILIDGFHND